MHTSNVWHLVIHAHVLLAGWVFTAAILQVDPVAHPTSHRLRAGVLIGFLALHSILAKRIYAHPPARGFPRARRRPVRSSCTTAATTSTSCSSPCSASTGTDAPR